jgi:Flp pilus assembly protein TadG
MKDRTVNLTDGRRSERGMTLVMVAISILLLMAMAALAVDVGVLYTARTSAQHAADSAALAGAYTFLNSTQPQPDSARNAAIAAAAKNGVMGKAVTVAPADVLVDTGLHRVTVTVRRNVGGNPINTFFAGALGISQMGTEARAVAEASLTGNASHCVKPVFVANTVLSSKDPKAACDAKETLLNPDGTISAFAKNAGILGSCLFMRPTTPKEALAPSQFYSLDFGSGANTYKCSWGQCLNSCDVNTDVIQCGKPFPLKTGNMVGPTAQGVSDLIGSPPDIWGGVGKYYPGGDTSKPSDSSRSLATVPVWDNCSGPPISPGTNGQTVTIAGFLEMFIDGQQGWSAGCLGATSGSGSSTWIKTHVVGEIACGNGSSGGGGPTPMNTGPFATPIRLVQVPAS